MIFFVIWKIKNWIENCPKSTFIFLKLLKIEQKWNGRFRTRMKTNFKKQKWISKKKKKLNFKKFFHFSIFVLKLKNEKWKTFEICFVFKSKNKLHFRYTDSKNIFHFSHLINAMKKEKRKTKFFFTLFWFKANFKKLKSKFSNKIFDFKSKNKFQKVPSFFNFGYKIEKWKTKNFQYLFCF